MKVAAVVSTKGGPGKTTVGANLGAFCADAGVRTLLIDLDNQPSLSSFYNLSHEAPGGTYQLITSNETRPDQIISQTYIPNLSLIKSNDPFNLLSNLLLHAADGRLRLKNLMPAFAQDFDLILIDTQGARSIVLEMALLGSQMAVSPITPDMLTAREFQRGMLQLYRDLEPLAALGAVTPMEVDSSTWKNNSYHSAVLRSPENHRWVTAMDIAIGQAKCLDDPVMRAVLVAIADWKLDKRRFGQVCELPGWSRLSLEARALVEASHSYYQFGTFPSEDLVSLTPPSLVSGIQKKEPSDE